MSFHLSATAAAIALITSACSPRSDGSSFTVADSAGVAIVNSAAPLWDPTDAWVLDSVAITAIGGSDADSVAMLQNVVGAMRLADGSVVVGDQGASNVKFFDASGRLLRTVGRRGKGPGEFEYIEFLLACGGDSAFVSDIGSRLTTVIAPDGGMARTMTIQGPDAGDPPFSTACHRAGGFLTTGWGNFRSDLRIGPFRRRVRVALTRRDGTSARQLGEFLGTEMVGTQFGAGPRRVGKWLRVAHSGPLAWIAPNENGDILGFDSTGTLRRIVRTRLGAQPMSQADREFFRRAIEDSALTARDKESVRRELATTPFPDEVPAVSALLSDAESNVWVWPHPTAASPNPAWKVYRADGALLGSVQVPRNLVVLEIGLDYILAMRDDELTGQTVVVLRLLRPS